jgi:hypothetical protein
VAKPVLSLEQYSFLSFSTAGCVSRKHLVSISVEFSVLSLGLGCDQGHSGPGWHNNTSINGAEAGTEPGARLRTP